VFGLVSLIGVGVVLIFVVVCVVGGGG